MRFCHAGDNTRHYSAMAHTKMAKGEVFSSFEEVKGAIECYQSEKCCQLYVKDSKTIASTLKSTPSRKINDNLRYSHLVYSCIAGGKAFKSRSNGIRPNQRYVFCNIYGNLTSHN